MTKFRFMRSEEVKNDLMSHLKELRISGARIAAIRFEDSLGGEEVWLTLQDGRVIHFQCYDYISVDVQRE